MKKCDYGMKKCDYGKRCLTCEEVQEEYILVKTGRGMDSEMLDQMGESQIAISCPGKDGYLVLLLTKDQIKEMTEGKLEQLSKEAADGELLTQHMISAYVKVHTADIQFKVMKQYPRYVKVHTADIEFKVMQQHPI